MGDRIFIALTERKSFCDLVDNLQLIKELEILINEWGEPSSQIHNNGSIPSRFQRRGLSKTWKSIPKT